MRFWRSNLESPFDFWKPEQRAIAAFLKDRSPEAEDPNGIPLAHGSSGRFISLEGKRVGFLTR
jgi:hypothetical protein